MFKFGNIFLHPLLLSLPLLCVRQNCVWHCLLQTWVVPVEWVTWMLHITIWLMLFSLSNRWACHIFCIEDLTRVDQMNRRCSRQSNIYLEQFYELNDCIMWRKLDVHYLCDKYNIWQTCSFWKTNSVKYSLWKLNGIVCQKLGCLFLQLQAVSFYAIPISVKCMMLLVHVWRAAGAAVK